MLPSNKDHFTILTPICEREMSQNALQQAQRSKDEKIFKLFYFINY